MSLVGVQERLAISTVHTDEELAQAVENRLPTGVIKALLKSGISDHEVFTLVIPRRTLAHRIARQEPLSHEESDRAVRLARITALAEQVFGERNRAWNWLRKPMKRFEDRNPMSMLHTEAGARVIEEMLYQLDEGFFA